MEGKMRATILCSLGNIETKIIDIPQINDYEVLVKVKYAGICGSDVSRSMIYGARKYPIVLGHEFAGEVAEVGANIEDFNVGDRVVVAPLVPCGECQYCHSSDYGLCDNYNIIGTGSNGAFAEYVKVPRGNALKIDKSLDLETAAGIEPATIGFHGLQKANIQPGDTVVVMGCGAIGLLTLQWAKIFGASIVIAVDIYNEKLALAKRLGADITINSKEVNAVEEIKEVTNGGAAVVAETAGSVLTQQQSILAAKKKGRVILLGITHKGLELSKEAIDHIMRGELTIKGSWNSYTPPYPGIAWKEALNFMTRGDIQFKEIISHNIALDDVGDYLRGMANGTLEFKKVLISFE